MSISVLFVCLGNICRSPTAHAVFQSMAIEAGLENLITVDSAGTGDWHIGKAPDSRATDAARSKGYNLSDLRGRQVTREDFSHFDFILAMDSQNLSELQAICPADYSGELALFLTYANDIDIMDVPDPYYGAGDGFQQVLDLVERASKGLLDHIVKLHRL